MQCLEKVKDSGVHSNIRAFISLNGLRNCYMFQFFPKDRAQSILQIFSLMMTADRLTDSAGFVLLLRKNLPCFTLPGIIQRQHNVKAAFLAATFSSHQ